MYSIKKKPYALICIILIICLLLSLQVNAEEPYKNYIYDSQNKAISEPSAYVPDVIINGKDLGIGDFSAPENIFVYNNELIYLCDTGNNRIVEMSSDYSLVRVIAQFDNNGVADTFAQPQSFFRTEDKLYIADTANSRIVVLNNDLVAVAVYEKPESKLITNDFTYEPTDIVVDSAGRMFIISKSVNDGIIELDENGEFVSFMGAVKAKLSFFEIIWRAIATKKQREKMQLSVPTEHACVDVDEQGFIYTTVSAVNENNFNSKIFVSRLNPMGKDILKRNGFADPMGDLELLSDNSYKNQYSSFVDITVRNSGIYSVLDQRMGRVFTYNSNGELMYVFGALGSNVGQFAMPVAIEALNRDTILVVDSEYNWISTFKPSDYGYLVTEAVAAYYNRDYDRSDELWGEALKYTSKSDLAFSGLGRSLIKNGEYEKAMEYLKSANDRENYSIAYKEYRSQLIYDNYNLIMIALFVIIAAVVIIRLVKRNKGRKK